MTIAYKKDWAQKHACKIERLFEQWQKPLGIDGKEYLIHLTEELTSCYDEPLQKSLIESICKPPETEK